MSPGILYYSSVVAWRKEIEVDLHQVDRHHIRLTLNRRCHHSQDQRKSGQNFQMSKQKRGQLLVAASSAVVEDMFDRNGACSVFGLDNLRYKLELEVAKTYDSMA